MDCSNSPRGWGGMAAGHGGRPISPMHRKDIGGIGTPPPARSGAVHQTPFTPLPVGVINFDPAKKPPRPPKAPKRVISGKLHAHAGGGVSGAGGRGGAGGTFSPRSSRRRKAMLLAPSLSSRGGLTRQKSTETSKTMTTVLGVLLTLLFGLLLLVQGYLVKEPPTPSLVAPNTTSGNTSPLLQHNLNASESSGLQRQAKSFQRKKAGIRLWGRHGGPDLILKDPKIGRRMAWSSSAFKPHSRQGLKSGTVQKETYSVEGIKTGEERGNMNVFGKEGIDNTLRDKMKEGEGQIVDTAISTALQGATKDGIVEEVSSMGHGGLRVLKTSLEV